MNRRDNSDAVAALEDDLDIWVALKDRTKSCPDERLIVDDRDTDRGRAVRARRSVRHGAGIVVVEVTCPSSKHTSYTSVRSKGLSVDS
ncbi:hypothetical protein [Brevibacterium sp. SMBL_HHYL_HB1]|uniref:hypothetical protein n=1 Tax=Brevibacterium sp. SMBL_HHYL_HB1 TaxID=2777556 RepID=UPI0020115B7E|nr:hypothetical protein [Brevibacterium sp. SMBL_HHYL_HB1]